MAFHVNNKGKLIQTAMILFIFVPVTLCAGWDYDRELNTDTGPDAWGGMFQTCKGNGQSPIDIDTSDVEYDDNLHGFVFTGFDTTDGFTFRLKNNGHSAQVDLLSTPEDFGVSGGGLTTTYIPEQFHFHWGSSDSQGSEHFIDHKQYPLEMHIVLYKNIHPNVSMAVKSGEATDLAVLGFLFEVAEEDNADFEKLLDEFNKVITPDTSTPIKPFPLSDLIGADPGPYYRYFGSLTTPTCNEVVIWTIFENTIPISSYQLGWFRLLENHHGHLLEDNYRPIQETNSRKVHHSNSNRSTGCYTVVLAMIITSYVLKK